ncbi:helix-turn-helix domain-containing protein [Actinomyces urogenitalis]|uniref:helix-turn-helix domain-containing protein n=1 Tax=Actinomyces urogenitalis TaxID=103621 RepID=UPI0029103464|nr:helix-turn-helix domain-containing protein [Actinomyces urogenitalis]MDU5427470.1 helix-turn-helix domain-containing protein [Actinomyces urogenitalis]
MDNTGHQSWLMGLGRLTPTQQLVAGELARLSDWRGVAIASVAHLVQVTGRSDRAVRSAIQGLVEGGHLRRSYRRASRRRAACAYALVERPAQAAPQPGDKAPAPFVVHLDDGGATVDVNDNEGLAQAIRQAVAEGWKGPATQGLARTVIIQAQVQFAGAIARAQALTGMDRQEAIADTINRAWEALCQHADAIAASPRPWAWWTKIVQRASYELDRSEHPIDVVPPSEFPEAGLRPGQGSTDVGWGIDDFGDVLGQMIQALVDAGMSETLATAGTRRIVELAMTDKSRRNRAAAGDPRLADMRITPECARAWMVMLAGSRTGARAGIHAMTAEQRAHAAAEVVRLLHQAA